MLVNRLCKYLQFCGSSFLLYNYWAIAGFAQSSISLHVCLVLDLCNNNSMHLTPAYFSYRKRNYVSEYYAVSY